MSGLLVIPNGDMEQAAFARTPKYAVAIAKDQQKSGHHVSIVDAETQEPHKKSMELLAKAGQVTGGNIAVHNALLQTSLIFDKLARKAMKSGLTTQDEMDIISACEFLENLLSTPEEEK